MREGFLLDYERLREDFPLLARYRGKLVYLDNAATSQKPRQVIEAVERFYRETNANILRGVYELGVRATRLYEEAHEAVAKFINAGSWREIVFTRNTTESINLAATMLMDRVEPGTNIVVTVMEHHSNLLPWQRLARMRGAELRVARVDKRDGRLDVSHLESLVDEKTRVVAVTHASNVLGVVNDVRRVARIAHSVDAYLVVDGAQSVPHLPVDVRALEADFLAFSGHKMLGPTGIGVLWGREDLLEELEPPLRGGGAVKSVRYEEGRGIVVDYAELPWRLEPGTPNIAGAIGLMEAVRYLESIGMDKVEAHERTLTAILLKRLEELGVRILGPRDAGSRLGIVAFTVESQKPYNVAAMLGLEGIAVRAGFHCAEPLHHYMGFHEGSVRASFYLYNGPDDIDALVAALEEIIKGKE